MKTGKHWSSWQPNSAWTLFLVLLPVHVGGCAKDRVAVERSLMGQHTTERLIDEREHYRAGCPDVLDFTVAQRQEFTGRYEIGMDGRINLGDYGKPRIEGHTLTEITQLLAAEIGVRPTAIDVRVAEYRSQHLLLFGEVIGSQRRVAYQGQETVRDLLQRVGGITAGAEPKDVYVVRPHLGESRRPEVIHVDLHAIVMRQDASTNIRLLPFDQIYVGETRQAQVERAIPPWLRGAYHLVSGVKPGGVNAP